jgi:hypothetical protein
MGRLTAGLFRFAVLKSAASAARNGAAQADTFLALTVMPP